MKLEELSGGAGQQAVTSPKQQAVNQQAAKVQAAREKVKKVDEATHRIKSTMKQSEAQAASKLAEVKKQREAAATAKADEDFKLQRQQRKAAEAKQSFRPGSTDQTRGAAAVNKPLSPRTAAVTAKVDEEIRLERQQKKAAEVGKPPRTAAPVTEVSESFPEPSENDRRAEALWMVFKMFDLDQSGTLTRQELLQLGRKRRELGQVGGEWDEESNNQLVAELGGGENGIVTGDNFVDYFSAILKPVIPDHFDGAIENFRQVALACQKSSVREEQERRNEALRAVFHLFDLDNDSTIDKEELLQLGQARRKLLQAQGSWDERKNDAMMKKMSGNTGRVREESFIDYYLSILSDSSDQEFDETMIQFKLVARECRLSHADSTGEDEPEEQLVPDDVNLARRDSSPSGRLLDSR